MDYRRAVWETIEYLRIKTFLNPHAEMVSTLWKEKGYSEAEIRELSRLLIVNKFAFPNENRPSEYWLGPAGLTVTFDAINEKGEFQKPGWFKRSGKAKWLLILIPVVIVLIIILFNGLTGTSTALIYRAQQSYDLYKVDYYARIVAHKSIKDSTEKSGLAYLEASTKNLENATIDFLEAKNRDSGKRHTTKLSRGLGNCYADLQWAAIARFNHNRFEEACSLYELAVDIMASDGKMDYQNLNNAASCAFQAKQYSKAIVYYKKLIENGAGNGKTWTMLAISYKNAGDTLNHDYYLFKGLKKYPRDPDLITESVNYKIAQGHAVAAIDELVILLAQQPDNSELNFVLGNAYDQMANPKSQEGKLYSKPGNYEELLSLAALYYKKAIELDSMNLDATYDLGVLYYNQSVEYYSRSEQPGPDAIKYKNMWQTPLPEARKYLEVSYRQNPANLSTLQALKAVYSQMNDEANYTWAKQEIEKREK